MAEVVSTGVSHMCDNSTVSVKNRHRGLETTKIICIQFD